MKPKGNMLPKSSWEATVVPTVYAGFLAQTMLFDDYVLVLHGFSFPNSHRLCHKHLHSAVSRAPLRSASMSRMRVLVVDDEQPVREIVAALLERLGHIAETAVDGREALRKFEATDFQLVFVDFQMPGMNGDELARELKQRKPAVPVVLITGSRTHTISTAIDRVLFKPFSMAQLRSTICSLS